MSTKFLAPGKIVPLVGDLRKSMKQACDERYGFIVTPLRKPGTEETDYICDTELKTVEWSCHVVAKMDNTYNIQQNPIERCREIESEISYAIHVGVSTVMIKLPLDRTNVVHLANAVNSMLINSTNQAAFWIHVPLRNPNALSQQHEQHQNQAEVLDTWELWNLFRSYITVYNHRLMVALDINGELPSDEDQRRWYGEPVKAVVVRTRSFLSNKQGYPVLPGDMQMFMCLIHRAMCGKMFLLLDGCPIPPETFERYAMYLIHLKERKFADGEEEFIGYGDLLQFPLQPLKDNLDSGTYEVFEKDPVKYSLYEDAVFEALGDLMLDESRTEPLTVMVVGAGRGPLVNASISAAKKRNIRIRVYVVEKNPNAIVTLRNLLRNNWSQSESVVNIEVVETDMRYFECEFKADLVVSELVGSFSDNELSPECLDGLYKNVKETTISIPQSYTSFIHPVQTAKLFTEVGGMKCQATDKPEHYFFEQNYVVFMKNAYVVGKPKAVFSYDHTKLHVPPKAHQNDRFAELDFENTVDYLCHGFAGYFDCVLYKDIILSTVPPRETPGLFSWFPIYFPLLKPIFVKKGSKLTLNMWRLSDKSKVWYEWCTSSPESSTIHNPKGRSFNIGLH